MTNETHIQRGFAGTPAGQLHYWSAGDGVPVGLLHAIPGSGRQYLPVLPELARRGYRAIAFDLPGFGESESAEDLSLAAIADALTTAMDDLALGGAHFIGHGLGATVAADLADRYAPRVHTLTLAGLMAWTREQWQAALSQFPAPPAPDEAGGHLAWAWDRALDVVRWWEPAHQIDSASLERATTLAMEILRAAPVAGRALRAQAEHDIVKTLSNLQVPVLVLSAAGDTLDDQPAALRRLIPAAEAHRFDGPFPYLQRGGEVAFVDVVHRFMTDTDREPASEADSP